MFSKEAINRVARASESNKAKSGPVDVQILPAEACNARCVFCPLFTVTKAAKAEHAKRFETEDRIMEWPMFERIVNGLKALGQVERFHITGGEPLLHPRISEMVKALKSAFPESSVTVVTNGIDLAKHASALIGAGLDCLSVSVNSATPESYIKHNPGHDEKEIGTIIDGIKAAFAGKKQGKPYISLTSVLTKYNFNEVAEHFDMTLDTGADAMTFIPLVPFEFDREASNEKYFLEDDNFGAFLHDIEVYSKKAGEKGLYLGYSGNKNDRGILRASDEEIKRACYTGWAFAMFWPDGSVRPCCGCDTVMGNINDESFEKIWNSDEYQKFRASSMENPSAMTLCTCNECGYLAENALFRSQTNSVGK